MTHSLLIAEPPLQVIPTLAEAVGFNEAAILQVIHYWLSPEVNTHFRNGRHWVVNVSASLLQRFFFWDEDTIGYILAQLEQSGILIGFQESSEVRYHTIDYEFLTERYGTPAKPVPAAPFVQDTLPKANKNSRPPFQAEVHVKGVDLYVMEVQDLSHFLACELVLEIQENDKVKDSRDIICHFPNIANEQFRKFVWEDNTLYEILMSVFQMKIMEQLLAFCATHHTTPHHTTNLVIFADDDQAHELGIYRDFLAYKNKAFTPKSEKAEITIPTNPQTFDAWLEFMGDMTIKFRQTLWKGQKTNPAIQHYLRSQDMGEFEG